jgi:hypothetical protein
VIMMALVARGMRSPLTMGKCDVDLSLTPHPARAGFSADWASFVMAAVSAFADIADFWVSLLLPSRWRSSSSMS